MTTHKRINTEALEKMGWQCLQFYGACGWRKFDLSGEICSTEGSTVWKVDLDRIEQRRSELELPAELAKCHKPLMPSAEVMGALGDGVTAKIGRMAAIYANFFAVTGERDSAACLTDTFYRAEM